MTYEVCYYVGDGIYSVNMIEGSSEAVFAEATTHAEKFGYNISYIHPLKLAEVAERKAKGMPFEKLEEKS